MAQTSLTISGQKSYKSPLIVPSDLTFTSSGGTNKITAASTDLSNFGVRDLIAITGTTSNNSTFTVKSVDTAGTFLTVEETVTAETADVVVLTYKNLLDGY